jgi:hypothetical protein
VQLRVVFPAGTANLPVQLQDERKQTKPLKQLQPPI